MIRSVTDKLIHDLSDYSDIEKIILFGSRARNDAEERSDIDLAIVCPNASDKIWLEICDKVENIDTLLEIDIVRFDSASPDLQQRISKEGVVIYEQN